MKKRTILEGLFLTRCNNPDCMINSDDYISDSELNDDYEPIRNDPKEVYELEILYAQDLSDPSSELEIECHICFKNEGIQIINFKEINDDMDYIYGTDIFGYRYEFTPAEIMVRIEE